MASLDKMPWIERLFRRIVAAQDSNDLLRVVDHGLEVARGNIAGHSGFYAYGERIAEAAETVNVVRPNGTFAIPPSSGVQMSISSTSADDAAGGANIRTVELHYLDVNLAEQTEIVTLNGTTPVLTAATDIRFINCMHAETVGANAFAAGVISATNDGINYSQIAQGGVRCASSARMIPAGKYCYVSNISASCISGTSAARAEIRLVASEIDEDQYLSPLILFPYGGIGVQDGADNIYFKVPLKFSAGTVIAMTAEVDKAATINASWYGWLENQ